VQPSSSSSQPGRPCAGRRRRAGGTHGRQPVAGEGLPGPYAWCGEIGHFAAGQGCCDPVDVAVDPQGGIYVVSRRCAYVAHWTSAGDFLGGFSGAGDADSPDGAAGCDAVALLWPSGIACDARGAVYVSDEGRRWVRTFSPSGAALATWGIWGWEGLLGAIEGTLGQVVPGRFARPTGIAVGADGGVYVVEAFHRRVERYTPSGELLGAWHDAGAEALELPWGIAVDAARQVVYVTDWRRDCIRRFDPEGRFLGTIGRPGSGPGELRRPAGVAVGPAGDLAVAEWGNDRVQVLTPHGATVAVLLGDESEGVVTPAARLCGPSGVAFDAGGTLYVADTLRHRVQVFRRRA
jgi:DNA-binding beta-propeller fold protein YncE